ncbi:MAG: NADH-quinone oxidoreductase subunit A [Planctomycetes bacterium]|nr:NADH-quinone oxidoreductase subunit A [Planctomycetota bacterium]
MSGLPGVPIPFEATASGDPRSAWASVVVVGLLAFVVVGAALLVVRVVTRVLDRIAPPAGRLSTYECGEEPQGSAWFRFNNRFTTVALAFLVCDVELALLWPVLPRCLHWLGLGRGGLVFAEVAAFVFALGLALCWVGARSGFAWDRTVEGDRPATNGGARP